MINPCEAIYTGADLEDAELGVVQFRSPGGTIKAVYLYVGDNVSDDAVFNISKNNVALWTLEDRLTVLDGESSAEKTGLDIATSRGDVIQLDLEEVPETGIASRVTLILEIDDGVESSGETISDEQLQDKVAAMFDESEVVYDDATGKLAIQFPESSGGLTTEQVQDVVGAMMVSGTNTLWTYDDALGTLKVDSANLSDEDIQDKVAAMLSAGTNVTVNYNDPAGTLTISSTDTTRTNEEIMDVVAALLTQGSNVTLTYNDGSDTLTIAASGGGGSYDGGRPTDAFTKFYYAEDFLGSSPANNAGAKWQAFGSFAPAAINGEAGHPGIIEATANSTTPSGLHLRANNASTNGQIMPSEMFDLNFIFRFSTAGVIGNAIFRCGLGIDGAASPPNNGIYIEKLAADTVFYGVTRAASTQTRLTTSAPTLANAVWYRVRIRRIDSSTIGFTIGTGGTMGTEITMTATIPTVPMNPFIHIAAGTGSVGLHVDFFDILLTGLSRY